MKLFGCQNCGNVLYFENTRCERCGLGLGYLPEAGALSALRPEGDGWRALAEESRSYRFCANAEHEACNWLLPAESATPFCRACRHNGTIPNLSDTWNLTHWRKLETAKHRLFYGLLRLDLPLSTRAEDPEHGLLFRFLADPPAESGPKVMTGHDNGVITIALVEADDVERERRRTLMGEPYRTLVGHFRHEVGHHYWDLLVRDGGRLEPFRALFGDEREDYGEALKRHHSNGPPADWQDRFVSTYATAHPWEDFAETWAHYLHIVDALETAGAFGVRVAPQGPAARDLRAEVAFDPYREESIQRLVDPWLPLTFALNSINRSMGIPDLYPFILAAPVIQKLGFIHEIVHARRGGSQA
jgi:hypothetical protein